MGRLVACLLSVSVLSLLRLSAAGPPPFQITEVRPGIYGVTSDRIAANAAIVVNSRDTIVVDTHFSPAAARELIAQLRLMRIPPVRYVVNTHWHGDHSNGNQAFLATFPDVEIVAHANTRADMELLSGPAHQRTLALLPQTMQSLALEEQWLQSGRDKDAKTLAADDLAARRQDLTRRRAYFEGQRELLITLPSLTFERQLVLRRDDREIELLHLGNAHTRGDVVVWLPRERVAITGDLLADKLWVGGGYPLAYLAALKQLARLDLDYVIPGHGPVLRGKAHLNRVIALLESLIAQVRHAVQQGLTLDETKVRVDLTAYRELITDWNISDGTERAFLELGGKMVR